MGQCSCCVYLCVSVLTVILTIVSETVTHTKTDFNFVTKYSGSNRLSASLCHVSVQLHFLITTEQTSGLET